MPLRFFDFCTLLSDLESISSRQNTLTNNRRDEFYRKTIRQWLHKHHVSVNSTDVDAVMILSSLLPARRTDRVYSIQARKLSNYLKNCLGIGEGRKHQLEEWKNPGKGDLGDCVERIQRQSENPIAYIDVTLEEVDGSLTALAQACRFSTLNVGRRSSGLNELDRTEKLQRIYYRLQSREAKWFTRLILKDYARLDLKERMILSCLDPRLPGLMKTQDSFESAIDSLRNMAVTEISGVMDESGRLVPKIGVKVGRANYMKGRSIRHTIQMIEGETMSVERKYDGEYFQVHINLLKGEEYIQIFSKSGKDSTRDRQGIHEKIKGSLRIGQGGCGFSKNCILEGEMVVWSDKADDVTAFHKIRKHVSRSGSFIGTAVDSQPHDFEHLMIFYFDVLVIDDEPVFNEPLLSRRRLLGRLVIPSKGKADLVAGRDIQFNSPHGPKQLQEALAEAFVKRWEGLVLKPLYEPYFKTSGPQKRKWASCWIKLKKDYIPGLGDTADFAIVGAAYNASEASKFKNLKLSWTRFHIGCLKNKNAVLHLGARPLFVVIDSLNACMKREDIKTMNNLGQFQAVPYLPNNPVQTFDLDVRLGVCPMSVTFREPFVFEVLGSGFERQPSQNFYTLRFPRVLKIHWDRTWKDTVDFDELQTMAEKETEFLSQNAPSEFAAWAQRLEKAERGKKFATLPWDDSEEDDDIEQTPTITSTASNPSTPQSTTPFLIRMDTREMGQRLLISPKLKKPAKGSKSTSQKRSSSSDDDGIENGVTKKARLNSPATLFANDVPSSPLANTPGNSSPAGQIEPLQPIINCTARVTDLSLVRKMSLSGANAHGSKGKSRQAIDSCSPGRETTASQASTTEESQLSPKLLARNTSMPSYNFSASATHFDLPQNPQNPEKVTRVEIPSLTESSFILSPSVAKMSYLQESFSSIPSTATIAPILLPTEFKYPSAHRSSPKESAPSSPHQQRRRTTVLLVESYTKDPTAKSMRDLILSIPSASSFPTPTPVAVWDWRLIDELKRGSEKEVDVRQHFFAQIEWLDGGEEEQEGGILVTWGDGGVTRVGPWFVGIECVDDGGIGEINPGEGMR